MEGLELLLKYVRVIFSPPVIFLIIALLVLRLVSKAMKGEKK